MSSPNWPSKWAEKSPVKKLASLKARKIFWSWIGILSILVWNLIIDDIWDGAAGVNTWFYPFTKNTNFSPKVRDYIEGVVCPRIDEIYTEWVIWSHIDISWDAPYDQTWPLSWISWKSDCLIEVDIEKNWIPWDWTLLDRCIMTVNEVEYVLEASPVKEGESTHDSADIVAYLNKYSSSDRVKWVCETPTKKKEKKKTKKKQS